MHRLSSTRTTPRSGSFDLIISDIDGCLSPEDNVPIDLAFIARVRDYNTRAASPAHDAPPPLTLCSGRPQPFAEAMCKLLDIRDVPCVCENGAWVYRLRDNRYDLDPAVTPEDLRAVRDLSDWVRREFGSPRHDRGHAVGVTQQPGKFASVSLYHPDTAYLKSLMPTIERHVASAGWPIRVSATWLYINLDLRHVSKGTGLDRMLAMLRLHEPPLPSSDDSGSRPPDSAASRFSHSRLAGIGDTTSDLPIRERCAFFACPANAHDQIKRLADYVSPFAEAEGVVDILRQIESRSTAADP
ncbi:MAG: HAD family hydrolase [Phycisphaerales bacterium]